jgi:ABC-type uncharacterized transport system ATPase subunit
MTATGMTDEHLLAVEGVTVSFDGFKAVDELSLYVEQEVL